jgi:hypothetical protein
MTVCTKQFPTPGVVLACLDPGAITSGPSVGPTLLDADEAPAAAVGDVAELGDVDVDQLTGSGPFVATSGLPRDPVDVGEPVEAAPHEHGVNG